MPMDRSLYPKNWKAIAHEVKAAAGWQCQECGRPCRKPGESLSELVDRLHSDYPEGWADDLTDWEEDDEFGAVEVPKPSRFILTVAHLDHVPLNCDRANLKALCSVCHCRYDLRQMARKKMLKRERLGQLNLLGGVTNGY